MQLLFDNRRQAVKVRVFLWASVVFAAGFAWMGWMFFQELSADPDEPAATALAAGLLVAALGAAFPAGMLVYVSRYLLKLERDGDRLALWTIPPTGLGARKTELALSQIEGSSYYHGRMATHRQSVNAPWITLRVTGQRIPYVIDLQAEHIDQDAIARLAQEGTRDWQADPERKPRKAGWQRRRR